MLHWKQFFQLNYLFFNSLKEIQFIIINVKVQKSDFQDMKSFNWMYHSPSSLEIDFNQFPLAQFAINFYNQHVFTSTQLMTKYFQNRVNEDEFILKAVKEQENHVSDLINDITMENSIKLEEKIHSREETQKTKNQDFKYFDPHEAPHLTFGIDDILTISKNQHLNLNLSDKNCHHYIKPFESQRIYFPSKEDSYSQVQFVVNQPNPQLTPFLIIKKKPIIKKKLLTTDEYENRARLIQITRVKNLQRMEVEERIGKKLPVKNKKWKRKKPSLVFNSQEYKKKLTNSKKNKDLGENYEQLFFSFS